MLDLEDVLYIAGTGHRPHKFNCPRFDFDGLVNLLVGQLKSMDSAPVVSGMALGFDTAWAMAALQINRTLVCAVPFPEQASTWSAQDRFIYKHILEHANRVVFVNTVYSDDVYAKRNKWMVDRAIKLVALWDGTKGGTSHCVRYATKRKVPVINLYEEWKAL